MKKVLIVDDDKDLTEILEILLKRAGFDVKIAQGVTIAYNVMKEFTPDVIVVDLNMPDRGGLDMIRELRQDPKWAALSMIVSSSEIPPKDREKIATTYNCEIWNKAESSVEQLTKMLHR